MVNQVDILMETNALAHKIYQTFEKFKIVTINTIKLDGQIGGKKEKKKRKAEKEKKKRN